MRNNAALARWSDRVLLVCMRGIWSDLATRFVETMVANVKVIFWNIGEPRPSVVDAWEGEWILSFRGDLIFTPAVLARATKGALNFHPAPPKYRGVGSHHYAIFSGDSDFGVTCHHMDESVDSGEIIRVERFAIARGETATSLGVRAGAYCLTLFYHIMVHYVLMDRPLPMSEETWGEKLYTYKDLEAWKERIGAQDPEHPCLR
jgi:methionyl-tRNA formyltransferase